MSTEQNKRVMIVVWRWSDASNTGVSHTDWKHGIWHTANGNQLVRIDMRKQSGRADFLSDLIASNFSDCEVTLFLHQNHPHNFNEKERAGIQTRLNKTHRKVRTTLFYGGEEPIYFAHNPLGILGINGDFPGIKIVGSNIIPSNFIEDAETKRFNQKHFDFVWDFYWYGRRGMLLELSELLRIRAFGYIEPHSPVGGFLSHATDTMLNDKLLSFTLSDTDAEAPAAEFDMRPYLTYIKVKKKKDYASVAENLSTVQQLIITLLYSTSVGEMAEKEMDIVYREMRNLYLSLPEYTI